MQKKHLWNEVKQLYWNNLTSDWRRANHYLRQSDRFYSRLISKTEKSSREEAESLYAEWRSEREPQQDEVGRLETIYWRKLAARHHLPEPENNDTYWERSEHKGTRRLTVAGVDYIQNGIYVKRKRRWELWIALATTLIGVIGGLTGFASVVLHH